MNLIDSAQINALSNFLNVVSARHTAVTTNIANIDTPGYRTRDVDFRTALRQAAMPGMMDAGFGPQTGPQMREVEGLMERPDGNNVSLERESTLLAQTQLQYKTATQLLRTEFHRLLTAINEGK